MLSVVVPVVRPRTRHGRFIVSIAFAAFHVSAKCRNGTRKTNRFFFPRRPTGNTTRRIRTKLNTFNNEMELGRPRLDRPPGRETMRACVRVCVCVNEAKRSGRNKAALWLYAMRARISVGNFYRKPAADR